uniref:Enoyl reductase (ER) domain-containing protein n=1 Tax=Mucochytrium quahogii TaxID=96639 RepID=A0A7S2SJ33_9STRA|mmetsp:Transcript_3247/g.4684  ORF Transcript_3247/g.4684 Transcript_3247/m.4684 type:complete len:306 (-) Transcript_3247:82-999(-)
MIGLNHLLDLGLYPVRKGTTDIMGLEVAGIVQDANGNDTDREVCALLPGGGYSEYCVAREEHCLPIPFDKNDPARFIKAAGLPETVFTVWKNLFWNGPDTLKEKRVFIHGGTSGIGTTAIEMARAFGASSITCTVGSEAKARFCKDVLGVDYVFDYTSEEWWEKAQGTDVILDMVGGDYLQKNISLLRSDGRLVIIGFLGSPISEKVNMTRVLLKGLTITGSVLRSSSDESKAKLCSEIHQHVWPRIDDTSIKLPYINNLLPLSEYKKGFELMAGPWCMGKIILCPDSLYEEQQVAFDSMRAQVR